MVRTRGQLGLVHRSSIGLPSSSCRCAAHTSDLILLACACSHLSASRSVSQSSADRFNCARSSFDLSPSMKRPAASSTPTTTTTATASSINDDTINHDSKRQRTDTNDHHDASSSSSTTTTSCIIDLELLSRRVELSASYHASKPYKHLELHRIVSDEFMLHVRNEILSCLPSTFKESDIFKLFQTMDLASISTSSLTPQLERDLAHLLALRNSLYSKEFRAFLTEVLQCGELIDRVDMSANVYGQGHHLLCHDDAIGKRKLSYIIYLPEPSPVWRSTDGGGLELYPVETVNGVYSPAVIPTKVQSSIQSNPIQSNPIQSNPIINPNINAIQSNPIQSNPNINPNINPIINSIINSIINPIQSSIQSSIQSNPIISPSHESRLSRN